MTRPNPGVWAICFAMTLAAPGASAFQLIRTPDGEPVRWESSCLQYSIHEDGAPGLPFEQLRQAVRASFDAWERPECSYFEFVETDPAECVEIGFNTDGGNMNLLVWVAEDWDHAPEAMALTTLSYDQTTGQILDADVEFNAEIFEFGVAGGIGVADVRNTATHEIGHMIGLDHASDPEATMYPVAFPGETNKRDINQDDEDGLCRLYPVDQDPESCDEPYCGLDLSCDIDGCDGDNDDDCSAMAPGSDRTSLTGIERVARLVGSWLAVRVPSAW